MIRKKYVLGLLMLGFAAASLHAAPLLPLVFEVPGENPVVAAEYQVQEGQDPLQLHVQLGQKAIQSLQTLTQKNLGKKILIKQGEHVLSSPTIKAALDANPFMISFQNDQDRREFLEHTE